MDIVEDILNNNSGPIEMEVLNEMTETLKRQENQSPPDHPFSHISDKEAFIRHNKGFIDLQTLS